MRDNFVSLASLASQNGNTDSFLLGCFSRCVSILHYYLPVASFLDIVGSSVEWPVSVPFSTCCNARQTRRRRGRRERRLKRKVEQLNYRVARVPGSRKCRQPERLRGTKERRDSWEKQAREMVVIPSRLGVRLLEFRVVTSKLM